MAWLLASAVGIAATAQTMSSVIAQLAPVITVILAAILYWVLSRGRRIVERAARPARSSEGDQPFPEERQPA